MDLEFHIRLKGGEKFDCPYCGRYAQLYKRSLHHSVAAWLIRLYRAGGENNFIEVVNLRLTDKNASSDYGIAKFWQLIQQKPHEIDDKKSSGFWKLTSVGANFVRGNLKIQKFAQIYDDRAFGYEGPEVSIADCLGDKFNYTELMAA